jgi:EAL domain-containing protein (putative c-di-GMP-specific phosphodiesterase class I)
MLKRSILTARKTELREHLRVAIERQHIWPAFQPIVDLRSGTLAGYEVLARWNDPVEGAIPPSEFIPPLERHKLIDMLFAEIVPTACRSAIDWPCDFTLAFNVSPGQLARSAFPDRLASLVTASGFPLERIQIEMTEGLLEPCTEEVEPILKKLDCLGVQLVIDDYGTGYSNLARLEAMPFRKLKIDKSFVKSLDTSARKRWLVDAIIGLGQKLGVTVVAEGVETEAEEKVLRDLNCDQAQGWLYARASCAADTAQLHPRFVRLSDRAN